MMTPVDYFFDTLLGNAINHTVAGNFDGVLRGAKLGGFTNTPAITQQSLFADFTAPTYGGYALASITWAAVFQDVDGSWALQGGLTQFQMSDDLVPTVLNGYIITDSTGLILIAAENFPAPIALPTHFQSAFVSPQFKAGFTGWGTATVIS